MPIERLTVLDRVMLGLSRTWPQDIGALAFLDGAPLLDLAGGLRIDLVRRAIASRLHLAPRFRQLVSKPGRGLGGPFWVDDPDFDVAQHVQEHPVRSPGGEAEVIETIEELRRRPLDQSQPLWVMWVLTGLADKRVGLYVRIHHAIADGMAAMATIASFLDTDPETVPGSPLPWAAAPPPSAQALLEDNLRRRIGRITKSLTSVLHPATTLRRLRVIWSEMRGFATAQPATRTSLDRMVGPQRNLALIRGDLEAVKELAHRNDATVNDVLLSLTAGGLRALLQDRGEPVEATTLRTYVPVSLRPQHGGQHQGNLIAQMVVPLPLGLADPVQRLRDVAAETKTRKAAMHTSLDVQMHNRIARGLLLKAVMRQRVNITTANIAGPPVSLYLASAPILEVFPVIPLVANEPLGVGLLSYAGGLYIGVVGDKQAFPDLDALAAAIDGELQRLVFGSHPRAKPPGATATGDRS